MNMDIGTRAATEQKLMERERFLKSITNTLPGMVGYWTAELRCAYANPAYLAWFGKRPEDMIGMRIQDVLGEELFRINEPFIRGALRGERQHFERTLVKANGEVGHMLADYLPDVEDGAVKGFVVVVNDVTELKKAQTQLEKLNEILLARTQEAEAANRAKGAFLSVMGHELRTPLHTILGYTGILQRQADASAKEMLATMDTSGRQLLRLIDDILDFGQGGEHGISLHPAYFSLSALAARLNSSARILALRRNNRFELELDFPPATQIEADEQRLTQILQNLIDNACKFTANGIVRLVIARVADGEDRPAPDGTRQRFLFAVEDTGAGIPEAQRATIFEPFVRAPDKKNVPGVGLGLAIARQLVEAMGSKLEVTSTLEKGSRFHFALACQADQLDRQPLATHRDGQIVGYAPKEIPLGDKGRQRTLVVADDIPTNRLFIERLCAFWGFRVIPAANGMEAIKACTETKPAPDAALVDQFMPVLDGWDFLRAIRTSQTLPDLPVVLISAAALTPPDDFPADLRFDAYLKKPVMQDDLAQTLADLLHLKWIREAESEQALPADDLPVPAFSAGEWDEFAAMVQMGRILALQQWVDALSAARPELYAVGERIKVLCKKVDLAGLQQILDLGGHSSHGDSLRS